MGSRFAPAERLRDAARKNRSMNESDPLLPRPHPRPLLFARAREVLAGVLSEAATDALPAIADRLDASADAALDGFERQALLSAALRLRRETASRVTQVADALARRAQRCLDALGRATDGAGAQGLALIDDEELETQILAADLARAARELAGVSYPHYAGRLRRLLGQDWADDDLNPLGARTLAGALVASIEGAAEGRARAVLRRTVLDSLAAPIAAAIERVDRMLDEAGVVPEVREEAGADDDVMPLAADDAGLAPGESAFPTAAESPGAGRERDGDDATPRAAPPVASVGVVLQAERDAATLGSSPLAGTPPGERLRSLPTLQPVLDIERDAVAFAHAVGAMPYSRQARAEFFGNVRSRLRESGAAAAQVAVVDLVAAMFDYVIDDRRLPEAARPLVWRLQQPAVALTLLDPAYLGDDPRSLRRLVEQFGAISTAYGDEIARGSELYRRLDTVVRAVEIVSSALQSRSAVMAQQVQKEYSRAARSVGQLIERVARERQALEQTPGRRNRRDYSRRPSREREKQTTERLRALIADRLQRHQPPESVREFVGNVWLRHLRSAALRSGEESAEFRVSLQVVDDLLWSLDEEGERKSRRELAQRIPPLIRLMTQGVREIGAREEEFKAFFDELFLIHLRRMQRRDRRSGRHRRGGDSTVGVPTLTQGIATGIATGGLSAGTEVPTLPGLATGNEPPTEPLAGRPAHAAEPAQAAPEPSAGPEAGPGAGTGAGTGAEEPDAPPAAHGDEEGTERRLIEILESLDLTDLPSAPLRRELDAPRAFDQLRRGDWIELLARDGASAYLKVAWINRRRTVVLLVREADRRALSLRADDLLARLAQRTAFLVG